MCFGWAGAAPRRGRTWPRRSAAVERREAPHPYVIGVHAPSQRRVADRASVRRALAEAPGASRRSISLVREGDGKRGKGAPGRPKTRVPGLRSVGCLTGEYELVRRLALTPISRPRRR
jgi:hypothetical protein